MLISAMDLLDLTVSQLRRAAVVKEQIEALNKELRGLLGASSNSAAASNSRNGARRKLAGRPATLSGNSAGRGRKKAFSAATRAKLSAKLKAYWAAKRAGKK